MAGCGPQPPTGAAGSEPPATTGFVRGSVMLADAAEKGHAGTLVYVAGTGYAARTDENGAYIISGVPGGEYGFIAEKSGYTTLNIDRKTVSPAVHTALTPLELQTGILEPDDSRLTTAGRSMRSMGSLHGIVTPFGAPTGENVRVRIDGTDVVTVSDEAGQYRLPNVDVGEVRLLFTMPGYQPERATATVEAGGDTLVRPVVIQPEAPTAPNPDPVPTAVPTPVGPIVQNDLTGDRVIRGVVEARDPEGKPINDYNRVTISIDNSDYVVTPDAGGRFSFDRLPAGLYTIMGVLDGLEPVRTTADLLTSRTVAVVLKLSEGTPINEASGTIIGRVVLEAGLTEPGNATDASGVTVGVAGTQLVALTAADGKFRMENVPIGTVNVVAGREGYEPGRKDGLEVTAGATVDAGEIRLEIKRDSPRVVSTSPANGAADVMVADELTVVIKFSKRMNAASVRDAVSFEPATPSKTFFGQGAHPRSSDDTLVVVLSNDSAEQPIRYQTNYRFTIARTASDTDGNPMKADYNFSFGTGGVGITSTRPVDGDQSAVADSFQMPILINFNAKLRSESVTDRSVRIRPAPVSVPRLQVDSQPGTGWSTIVVFAELKRDRDYTVTVTRNVRTANGEPISRPPYNFSFRTLTEPSPAAAEPARMIR